MNTKTIYRNARTKRPCRADDPEAEALVVPTKRVRRVGHHLYRFDRSKGQESGPAPTGRWIRPVGGGNS